MANSSGLIRFLSNLPLESIHAEILTVDVLDDPISCFLKLTSNHFSSAPVMNQGKFCGFVDMKDLVEFVVFAIEYKMSSKHKQDMFKIASQEVKTEYLAMRHQSACVSSNATYYDVAGLLIRGFKRVAVLDSNDKVLNVITQSNVVKLLSTHLSELEAEFPQTIQESKIGHSPITVSDTMPAIDVLRTMVRNGISGVPIISSDDNEWIATFTASDLHQFIINPVLEDVLEPITSFLSKMRKSAVARNPTMFVQPSNTLSSVISKFVTVKVHRLFIADKVDGQKIPVAVFTLADLLSFLLEGNTVGQKLSNKPLQDYIK